MGKCFQCGEVGHRVYECPQIHQETNKKGATRKHMVQEDKESIASPEDVVELVHGESLMFRRILVNPSKEENGPSQRGSLFRTVCKSRGNCCKISVDSGSTNNLVSEEMVEKLGLKRIKHPNPYKVGCKKIMS